jgi:hypothetical protein
MNTHAIATSTTGHPHCRYYYYYHHYYYYYYYNKYNYYHSPHPIQQAGVVPPLVVQPGRLQPRVAARGQHLHHYGLVAARAGEGPVQDQRVELVLWWGVGCVWWCGVVVWCGVGVGVWGCSVGV